MQHGGVDGKTAAGDSLSASRGGSPRLLALTHEGQAGEKLGRWRSLKPLVFRVHVLAPSRDFGGEGPCFLPLTPFNPEP
jgi:hypothetical protein